MDEIHSFSPSELSSKFLFGWFCFIYFLSGLKDTISHIAVSTEGNFLALADCSSRVVVFDLKTWVIVATLPTYTAVPTAIGFPYGATTLLASYSDNKVCVILESSESKTFFHRLLNSI